MYNIKWKVNNLITDKRWTNWSLYYWKYIQNK